MPRKDFLRQRMPGVRLTLDANFEMWFVQERSLPHLNDVLCAGLSVATHLTSHYNQSFFSTAPMGGMMTLEVLNHRFPVLWPSFDNRLALTGVTMAFLS